MEKIERFIDDFAFLSNFFSSTIYVDGKSYATVEHAYQAFKTLITEEHEIVRKSPSAASAKRCGRAVTLRPDWEHVKIDVMRRLVKSKFENPILREMLLATGDAELIEGNYWNDKFWGVCRSEGQNWLGKILMEVRNEINAENAADEV